MSNLRVGQYGNYYASYFNQSVTLNDAQQRTNATYIYNYLTAHGWTVNAIAGILGNMQHESALNSGRWQSDNVGATNKGYGLVQWTPAVKYLSWCAQNGYNDASEMDNNLSRIIFELNNGIQYYKTSLYNYNFATFSTSLLSPYELACAFAWNYERSNVVINGTNAQKEALRQRRGGSANYWYEFLTNQVAPPTPSIPLPSRKTKMKFLLLNARGRREQWKKKN